MSRERRLGRGLEALLGRPLPEETPNPVAPPPAAAEPAGEPAVEPTSDEPGLVWLNIYEVDRNPFQPRKDFDPGELQSLYESILEHGMLQPLVVRRSEGRFELVSGERRLRAATMAGWEKVPVQIREADDRQMAELALVENIQRKDLNSLEKAASFQQYLEKYGCTQEELASRVKVDRSTIANLVRLLELPEPVQAAVRSGTITQGHARALLPLGDEREQIAFCERIQREALSVRATEDLVQETIHAADVEPLAVIGHDGSRSDTARSARRVRNDQLASLEQELRISLGTKVDLRQTGRGRGRIIIHFKSQDEFDRLRAMLSDGTAGGKRIQAG